MNQQKAVVGYASEGWNSMLDSKTIILKQCKFYWKVMMLLSSYFSLSHSVENQLGKPLSHPVVQGASTKANSRLHHV